MIITKKVMRNVSLTAHPEGCKRYVQQQIDWVKNQAQNGEDTRYSNPTQELLPKRVLVIGGSTGYGLSSRIVAAYTGGADTINVSFEREPAEKKTATPGWYNTMAFEQQAKKDGMKACSVFGDAFSTSIKEETARKIKEELGQVDLVIYSLASPLRNDPVTGVTYRSVLKPIGKPFTALSVDLDDDVVKQATIDPATDEQVQDTVKVMGGEDWSLWVDYLLEQGLLAEGAMTVAYSYIGPKITYPVYREGTIGKAKEHLENSASALTDKLEAIGGKAFVSVNKALVTRASAVIPVVPLYMALLYQVMKEKNIHEHCTQQIYRLFLGQLYTKEEIPTDQKGRLRVDDWEMLEEVQNEVERRWALQKEGQPLLQGDLDGVLEEYEHIHGFGFPDIDYGADIDPRIV
ncbi:enoyl-ACP reductase FabV [uncultured Sphaerochaeta sp.]|uniref:enoyl-ACP reductase FabV n=1 Tax=uncultured Sphaerochaeta sp. TaxID=886478 RepID=UPI002AA8F419|nr:enoyl-ACP reductase FabV [uncultured Sphaerochaeta sp.]